MPTCGNIAMRSTRSAGCSARIDSTKAPDALLIIGTAESSLGDNAAARKTFEEVIARYPSSDAAEKAKGRMAKFK